MLTYTTNPPTRPDELYFLKFSGCEEVVTTYLNEGRLYARTASGNVAVDEFPAGSVQWAGPIERPAKGEGE